MRQKWRILLKNDMKKIFEYDPVIYPRKIWVSIGASTEELSAEFEGIEDMDDSAIAVTYHTFNKNNNLGGVLIRFNKKGDITASIAAHEATHAALDIYEYVGAKADVENQEPFAYLVGFVTDCIWSSKNNKERK